MWQAFGGQESTKVKDVEVDSLWTRIYRGLAAAFAPFRAMRWYERLQAVHNVLTFQPWYFGLGMFPSSADGASAIPADIWQRELGFVELPVT